MILNVVVVVVADEKLTTLNRPKVLFVIYMLFGLSLCSVFTILCWVFFVVLTLYVYVREENVISILFFFLCETTKTTRSYLMIDD